MQDFASVNLTMKTESANTDASRVMSLVPGVMIYQIKDSGVDLQANWGGMMYMKDSHLN
jgi:hypothetical protein